MIARCSFNLAQSKGRRADALRAHIELVPRMGMQMVIMAVRMVNYAVMTGLTTVFLPRVWMQMVIMAVRMVNYAVVTGMTMVRMRSGAADDGARMAARCTMTSLARVRNRRHGKICLGARLWTLGSMTRTCSATADR